MQAKKSALHKIALELAAAGTPVFPLVPGAKRPLTEHGLRDRSAEEWQVDAWWQQWPDANIGVVPDDLGYCVLDVDGEEGQASLNALEIDTLTMRSDTPNGGYHLWYAGSLPPSTGKYGLGPNLDVRGWGSYVLWPGSKLETGEYTWQNRNWVLELPAKVRETLDRPKRVAAKVGIGEQENFINLGRADSYLVANPFPTEGSRNDETFKRAAHLRDLGLSEATTLEKITAWNEAGAEPLEADEIELCVWSAYNNGQNAPGSKGFILPDDWDTPSIPPKEIDKPVSQRDDDGFVWAKDMASQPEVQYAVRGLIPVGVIELLGPPSSYKSFLALDIAGSIAAGAPVFGEREVCKPGDAVYCAGEASFGMMKQRWPALAAVRGFDPEQTRLAVVKWVPQARQGTEQLEKVIEKHGAKPAVIVIDTVARTLLGEKEDEVGMGLVIGMATRLSALYHCLVILVHHTGKDESRGGRGSNAMEAGTDAIFRVERGSGLNVILHNDRQKDTDEKEPIYLKGAAVAGSVVFQAVRESDWQGAWKVDALDKWVPQALIPGPMTEEQLLASILPMMGLGEDQAGAMKKRLRDGKLVKLSAYWSHETKMWRLPGITTSDDPTDKQPE